MNDASASTIRRATNSRDDVLRARVEATGVIDAPIDRTWDVVRDFSAGGRWLPAVVGCEIEDGMTGTTIGAIRRLTLADGRQTRERLLGLSDVRRQVELAIVESALPVRNYIATFRLTPISDGDRCLFSWSAEFEAEPDSIAAIGLRLRDQVFRVGFGGLSATLM